MGDSHSLWHGGMEWPLVLGLTWLKRWNPKVNWKEGTLRFQWGVTGPGDQREELGENPKKEMAMVGRGEPTQGIPQEYKELAEVFSGEGSDELSPPPPHRLYH